MPKPLPPPVPTDEVRAAAQDEVLLRSRLSLARALADWVNQLKLSHRQVTALSTVASGRNRLPPTTLTRIRQVAGDPSIVWFPQPCTLIGLGDLNALVAEIAAERVPPPYAVRDIVHRLKPLLRVDGGLLTAADMAQVLVGVEGILEPALVTVPDRERIEALIPVLSHVIERAIIDAGRSPLRDAAALLALYPLPEERSLLRRVLEGDAYLTPEQLHEMLPGLTYALSRFTGTVWNRETLLAAAPPLVSDPT